MVINRELSITFARLRSGEGGIEAFADILKGNIILADKLEAVEVAYGLGVINEGELEHPVARPEPEDFGLDSDKRPSILPEWATVLLENPYAILTIAAALFIGDMAYLIIVSGADLGTALLISFFIAPTIGIGAAIGMVALVAAVNAILPNAGAHRAYRKALQRHETIEAARAILSRGHDIKSLYAAGGQEFERRIARAFRQWGFDVDEVGGRNDGGIDLVVRRAGIKGLVQCKAFAKPVSPAVVRELYGTLTHSDAQVAILATLHGISKAAAEWAQGKPIIIMKADDVLRERPPAI
ncbi:restriction endonuclease [Sphingomonas sp. HF-S4]|uniref:Restriction endonuclease n=1 Tax=Sphingomonas agrestis TaxID=3080540 RepID=A0ABU3Y3C9_9SPHN|nr:restriction endonuclease [Sphingomonas sp. HF-S4]MDV3455874.1 restriction endonuclease [Sphingomonas sp. HF-S4]